MNNDTNIIAVKLPDIKSKIYLLLKLIIAFSLIVYLVYYVQSKNIIDTFSNANFSLLLLSLMLLFPNIYLQYWKWKLTCEQLISEKRKKKVLLSLFYGFPAAIFTPARTGEYFGRGMAFKDRAFTEIVLATFIDKFFTVIVTFFMGTASAILFVNKYYHSNNLISLPLLIVFLFISVFTLAIMFSNKEWLSKFLSPLLKYKVFAQISKKILMVKNLNRAYVIKMLSLSMIFLLCYVLQFMILIAAFSHHFDLLIYFWAAILIMFAKSVLSPLSISELGVREAASVFFLTQIGETSSIALNASLAIFIINIIIPSLIGLFFLFVKNDD